MLVTASPETRGARLAEAKGSTSARRSKLVAESDAGRADYLKRFYGLRAEPPTLYDLVVNTDRLSLEEAARLIAETTASAPAG